MDLNLVKEAIKKLFKEQNGSQISKATGLPYQTVQDLRNGRTNIEDARFRTVEALYNYQKELEEMEEIKSKVVEVENPNNIVEYESLVRYYIDIINNQDSTYEVEYAELAKVEHDNGNEYYTVELNTVREIKFTNAITDDVDLDNFYSRFETEDQKGETQTDLIYFDSLKSAKDYAEVFIEGIDSFEKCAKKIGIIE